MVRDARRRAPHHEGLISLPPKKARCPRRRSDITRRPGNTGRTWWRRLLLRISKKVSGRGRTGLDRARLFRLRRRVGCRCRSFRRNGSGWGFALGLFAADFAARPGEIIGAAGGRRERLALDQRPRGERVDRGRARAGAAEQLIGADRGCHQRHDRSRQRTRRRLARQRIGVRRRRFGRQRSRGPFAGNGRLRRQIRPRHRHR